MTDRCPHCDSPAPSTHTYGTPWRYDCGASHDTTDRGTACPIIADLTAERDDLGAALLMIVNAVRQAGDELAGITDEEPG